MAKKSRCIILLAILTLSILLISAVAEASILGDLRATISRLTAKIAKNPDTYPSGITATTGVRGAADPFFNYESYASRGQSVVSIDSSPANALQATDTDYDGIPNWYEAMANQGGYKMNYLIYEPQTAGDYDGDGCTNYEEYYNYKQIYKCAENVGGVCPTDGNTIEIVRCSNLEEQNMPMTTTINGFTFATSVQNMSFLRKTNLTLTHANGNISFDGANMLDINASLLSMGQDYIYANVNRWPGFNRSARIGLNGLTDSYFGTDAGKPPVIIMDGSPCGSHCTNIVWSPSTDSITFTVDGFPDGNVTGKSYYVLVNSTVAGASDGDSDSIPDSWSGVTAYCNSNVGNVTRCKDNCPVVGGVLSATFAPNTNQSNYDGDDPDVSGPGCNDLSALYSGGDTCDIDIDNDGITNTLPECDSNNDCGIFDAQIGGTENDIGLCNDTLDNDCDSLTDAFDQPSCNMFSVIVFPDQDTDGDQVPDVNESNNYGTNYKKPDTDLDGLHDNVEAVNCASKGYNATKADTDGDRLVDGIEDWDGDCQLDPCVESNVTKADTDGDGLTDKQEYDWNHKKRWIRGLCRICVIVGSHCTHNPNWAKKCAVTDMCLTSNDTDGDGLTDFQEYNSDTDPADIDIDDDGLNNSQETALGTNMSLYDTDFDGLSDYEEEITYTSCDSLDNDTGNMGMTDGMKITMGYQCGAGASADCDNDGLTDAEDPIVGTEANITIEGISDVEVTVGGDTNLNQDFTGVEEVNITNTTDVIMSAEYDFTEDVCKMTFTQSTVAVSTSSDKYGWAMVSGVLQCGATKTLFIPANAGTKRVCIKDAEVDSISDVSDSCTGASEVFFDNCDESGQSVIYSAYDDNNMTYNCTYLPDEDKYMIDGLHHSAGMETTNARLNISDDTDTLVKFPLQTVYFYANYSNRTNGEFIGSNSCNITLDNGVTWYNMTQGTSLYTYSTTYPAPGTYYFNVSCNATALGFDFINLQDNVYITSDAAVPEFSDITAILALAIVGAGFLIMRRKTK